MTTILRTFSARGLSQAGARRSVRVLWHASCGCKHGRHLSGLARSMPATVCQATRSQARGKSTGNAPEFLSEETWESLGVSDAVSAALQRAGFLRPASLQAQAIPRALRGGAVVIAAETGSGKTLAYGIPVIETVIRASRTASVMGEGDGDPEALQYATGPKALVLLPTGVLCDQILSVLNAICDDQGAPLVSAARLSTSTLPARTPDVVVTTPAALQAVWTEISPGYSRGWLARGSLLRGIRVVVMDEADLVLTASARATEQVLELLRLDDNERISRICMAHLGLTEEEWRRRKVNERRVAFREGPSAFLELVGASPRKGVGKEPFAFERQYVFVGATMPDTGLKGVASSIAERWPDATWVQGKELHRSKSKVRHRFIQVDDDTWADSLVRAVTDEGCGSKVMVFAAGKGYADEAAEVLARAGMRVLLYHAGVPMGQREQALREFYDSAEGVLVCTDSASRGLDIPGVTHVVQADFAATAMDFIHRIGRTARAGGAGSVTSFFTEKDAALAGTIRAAVEEGKPVEACFSRNRSFRKKVRRKGEQAVREQIAGSG